LTNKDSYNTQIIQHINDTRMRQSSASKSRNKITGVTSV